MTKLGSPPIRTAFDTSCVINLPSPDEAPNPDLLYLVKLALDGKTTITTTPLVEVELPETGDSHALTTGTGSGKSLAYISVPIVDHVLRRGPGKGVQAIVVNPMNAIANSQVGELDAAVFHLYCIVRDDVDYIMDTFPIVRRNDEKAHGTNRTKEAILDLYDRMQRAIGTGVAYQTELEPGPADARVAHPDTRKG